MGLRPKSRSQTNHAHVGSLATKSCEAGLPRRRAVGDLFRWRAVGDLFRRRAVEIYFSDDLIHQTASER